MSDRFNVSKAIVTGGARGIGAAIAERLASEGLSVTVLDVNEAGVKATADRISTATGSPVFGFGCDVADRASVEKAFGSAADAMNGIDTYIGNAGITRDRMFHKLTDEDWDQVIAVNLTGVFNGLRFCAPYLRAEGPGRADLVGGGQGREPGADELHRVQGRDRRDGALRCAGTGQVRHHGERDPSRVHRHRDDRRDAGGGAGRDGQEPDRAGRSAF